MRMKNNKYEKSNKISCGLLFVVSRFTFGSVAVHLSPGVKHGPLPRLGKIMFDKISYARRLHVRCSAVFSMKQCGRPYDVVHLVSAKKLLRKRRKVMWFTSR